jgi:hypothetical protein
MKKALLTAAAIVAGALAFSPAAHADEVVTVCSDGHSGVAQGQTSCAFAQNVRAAYFSSGGPVVAAYSPATGEVYTMQCAGGFLIRLSDGTLKTAARCVGGNNAVVWGW